MHKLNICEMLEQYHTIDFRLKLSLVAGSFVMLLTTFSIDTFRILYFLHHIVSVIFKIY